jgi:hypothetical protein
MECNKGRGARSRDSRLVASMTAQHAAVSSASAASSRFQAACSAGVSSSPIVQPPCSWLLLLIACGLIAHSARRWRRGQHDDPHGVRHRSAGATHRARNVAGNLGFGGRLEPRLLQRRRERKEKHRPCERREAGESSRFAAVSHLPARRGVTGWRGSVFALSPTPPGHVRLTLPRPAVGGQAPRNSAMVG